MTCKVTSKLLILICSLTVGALAVSADAVSDEYYPFLAESTADRVNVRAGQNTNYESLCFLEKGEEVVVVGKKYKWYQVKLPNKAKSFIHIDYVLPLGRLYGEVTANRINIRAGAGTKYSVLGQLNTSDKVRILEKEGDWYKIEPIEGSSGWVAQDYLAFKSKSIASYLGDLSLGQKRPSKKKSAHKAKPVFPSEDHPVDNVEKAEKVLQAPEKRIILNGYLKPVQNSSDRQLTYQLTINNQPIYNLRGARKIFSPFDAFKVTVEGTVDEKAAGPQMLPVLNVSSVKILL